MCPNDSLTTTTTTREVVTDYFNWRLKNKTSTNNPLFLHIRKIAYDCETLYNSQQPTFNLHMSSLSLTDIKNIHYEIAKELFDDQIISWSRIITFISFSAILAQRFVQQQHDMNLIIDWTTDFIDINLHTWLEKQNYWVGCLNTYDKTSQRRNSLSRYASILGTIGMLTLGAWYMKRT